MCPFPVDGFLLFSVRHFHSRFSLTFSDSVYNFIALKCIRHTDKCHHINPNILCQWYRLYTRSFYILQRIHRFSAHLLAMQLETCTAYNLSGRFLSFLSLSKPLIFIPFLIQLTKITIICWCSNFTRCRPPLATLTPNIFAIQASPISAFCVLCESEETIQMQCFLVTSNGDFSNLVCHPLFHSLNIIKCKCWTVR